MILKITPLVLLTVLPAVLAAQHGATNAAVIDALLRDFDAAFDAKDASTPSGASSSGAAC